MKSTARLRVGVLLVLTVVALVSSLLGVLTTGDWGGFALNLGTEMVGAVVTYLLLELVIGRMERREAEKRELEAKKVDLIAQLGSQVQDVAVAAAEELERHGWLSDGSLQGADLSKVNLEGANLQRANLQGARLFVANLQRADLSWANLQGASLREANLQGAFPTEANLQGADLTLANLRGIYLAGANLQRASLVEANLEGAFLIRVDLQEAEFSQYTILPDGTKWTPDTDMTRFTDRNHPDFWHPDAQ